VVINGCRRLAAAKNFGRPNLDIVVKDEVAKDRETLLAAAVFENVGRRDFDVIEEAKAVELLIGACGTVEKAAMKLAKSKGWISQRRALLQLTPGLQTALRNGELAIRIARSLAQVPPEEQVEAWNSERERQHQGTEPDSAPTDSGGNPAKRMPVTAAKVTRTFRRLDTDPVTLADALVDYLDADGLQALIKALTDRH
jgi:ParB family chromosome partitioning protein